MTECQWNPYFDSLWQGFFGDRRSLSEKLPSRSQFRVHNPKGFSTTRPLVKGLHL